MYQEPSSWYVTLVIVTRHLVRQVDPIFLTEHSRRLPIAASRSVDSPHRHHLLRFSRRISSIAPTCTSHRLDFPETTGARTLGHQRFRRCNRYHRDGRSFYSSVREQAYSTANCMATSINHASHGSSTLEWYERRVWGCRSQPRDISLHDGCGHG